MIKKIHYPNLNALRFVAAFVVIVHHTEQIKYIKGLPNIWNNNAVIPILGKLGVDLFFVLSGFLITSLLFVEAETPGGINVKNFIIRRLLRIWPVYFAIVIVAFFIMPHFASMQLGMPFKSVNKHFATNLLMYVLFLPHVQAVVIGPVLYAAQAWSIGIEEQFYLVWSSVVKYFSTKKLVAFIIVFIVIYLIFCIGLSYMSHYIYNSNDMRSKVIKGLHVLFQEILKFDCLLIGGLFAVINNNVKAKSFLRSKAFQLICYLTEAAFIGFAWSFYSVVFWEIHAIMFGFIIMNLVHADTSIVNIEYPIFSYLGKISYGLYMYHFLVINVAIWLVYKLGMPVLLYPVVFGGVILLAALSYKYFETYFLKKKNAFSSIITG